MVNVGFTAFALNNELWACEIHKPSFKLLIQTVDLLAIKTLVQVECCLQVPAHFALLAHLLVQKDSEVNKTLNACEFFLTAVWDVLLLS